MLEYWHIEQIFMTTKLIDVHAHEILEMMIKTEKRYSNESLAAEVLEAFGPEARFYTCSGMGLDHEEIVVHLWEKHKFTGTAEDFVFMPSSRCDH